ncbi:MAG: histidine kinase, partial [Dehalococcoidia bacterium]
LVVGPLPRFIGRIGVSVRWKVLVAIGLIALMSMAASIVNNEAMVYMHDELHEIQDLPFFSGQQVRLALTNLEDTQHGWFFSLMPFLSILAALVALGLGVSIALSVINPVRRMGQAMRRIASGDFRQPLRVDNRDELGELANHINRTAEELARLQEATLAEERARALQERVTQVTLAQEEERRRISRELHDGLGPSLASIATRLRGCQQMVSTDPRRAETELAELSTGLRGHIQDIRELIYDLRPLALDQLGLVEALRQQVERFGRQNGIQAAFNCSGDVSLGPLAEVTAYRLLQECLGNVQKHAKATRVEVVLQAPAAGVELRVKDNGQGFDRDSIASGTAGRGMGLLGMRERVELLGGSLALQSSPGNGCEIALYVPSSMEVEVGADPSPIG